MTRKYRRWWHLGWDWRWKRLSTGLCLGSVNLPRISFDASSPHGDEYESRYIALNYGTSGSDPVFYAEVNLAGTRAGWLLAEVVWWFREHPYRARHRRPRDWLRVPRDVWRGLVVVWLALKGAIG